MLSADLRNPFHTHKADDTVTLPAGDVPGLHGHALKRCQDALDQARRSGSSVGVLIVGEAGGGKSHLVAQLRRRLADDPTAVLAAVRLGKAYTGRLWRHLRERLVEELLRSYAEAGHGGNGLLRVLRNRFPEWADAARGPSGSLSDWQVGRGSADLAPHLDQFARGCPLDYGLVQVLPQLGDSEQTRLALDWLRGQQLSEADLRRLGLPPVLLSEQEQEVAAQDVALSLLRLAGERTTLLIGFDEVEAIQAGTWDAAALRQFTTLATGLLAEPGPRVVVTCVRPRLLTEMQKAVESSNLQKLRQDFTSIYPLDLDAARRVVAARLDAEPTCRAARQARPGEPCWPIGEAFLAAAVAANPRSLTPRALITACQEEFDRLQQGSPEAPKAGPPTANLPRRPLTPEQFFAGWANLRARHLDSPSQIPFERVLAIGLPWLVRTAGLPFDGVAAAPPGLPDVDLLFRPMFRAERPVAVSFCNHEPRPLPWRLDRVKKQWAKFGSELQTLVVLRAEAERTTENARARLEGLRRDGVRVVLIDWQQLAEVAAFQVLMTKSLEGNLLNRGQPIDPAEYDAWAKGHLSEAVKELLHLIFEPDPAKAEPRQRPSAARM